MIEKKSFLYDKIGTLYSKIERAKEEVKVLERRFSICLGLLQEAVDNPWQSEIFVKRAINSFQPNILTLERKVEWGDYWMLLGLSYKTYRKYLDLPEWSFCYNHHPEPYSGIVCTTDEYTAYNLIKKMIQQTDTKWEYIDHISDLIND